MFNCKSMIYRTNCVRKLACGASQTDIIPNFKLYSSIVYITKKKQTNNFDKQIYCLILHTLLVHCNGECRYIL